jgi:hypothetical protein
MLGSNLKRREVIRCLDNVFGGCWAGIHRLGKKIGSRKIPQVSSKAQSFSTSYLFTKSTDPCQTTGKQARKDPSLICKRQIAPKHHRQSEPNEFRVASEKRLLFLNTL